MSSDCHPCSIRSAPFEATKATKSSGECWLLARMSLIICKQACYLYKVGIRNCTMSRNFSIFNENENDTYHKAHPMRAMPISDSKSLNTTISPRSSGDETSEHSGTCTTYCSQPPSPLRCEPTVMDRDLRGIGGYGTELSPRGSFGIPSPSPPSRRLSLSSHSVTNIDSAAIFSDTSSSPISSEVGSPRRQVSWEDEEIVVSPNGLTPVGLNENLEAIGGSFNDLSVHMVCAIDENSNSSDNSDDDDIDLEKFAGDALSQWFGLNIDRFPRPIRVIHAFEQVKEQMAAIVMDEGQLILNDEDGQEEQGDEENHEARDPENQPHNTEEAGQAPLRAQSQANDASTGGRGNRKRSSNGNFKSESPGATILGAAQPKKKRRVDEEFSCPYRKRNPLRFNVRNHEACASRAYRGMTLLK